jgi:penicillin-binding protein 1A
MVTLKWGLANSVNTISAWLMKQLGPQGVIQIVRKMGVRSKIDAVPSICLGTADLSLYEMVGAFSTFANKGVYTEPIFVKRIEDRNGNVLATFKPKCVEAISEETDYFMQVLLRAVVTMGTSARVAFKYGITNDIMAKTGTTQNQSDGWYMGLTPNLVSGVWVGGEDRSIHFASMFYGQGASTALPIWALYMKKVYADTSLGYKRSDVFEKPRHSNVETDCAKYNKDNGEEEPVEDGGEYIEGEIIEE